MIIAIEHLEKAQKELDNQMGSFDRYGLDHGSLDQTRAILLQSIFETAMSHVDAALRQAKILQEHLY